MSNYSESLRAEIDIEIPYISEEGKKGLKKVHISFISQGIYNAYSSLINDSLEIIRLRDNLEQVTQKMGEVANRVRVVKGEDGKLTTVKKGLIETRDKMKELQGEYDRIIGRINDIADHIDERKQSLIHKILVKNGIEDSDLNSPEWWKECTGVAEDMRFIKEACEKDNALLLGKKKLQAVTKSSI